MKDERSVMPDSPTRSAVLRMPHCNLRPKAGKKFGRCGRIFANSSASTAKLSLERLSDQLIEPAGLGENVVMLEREPPEAERPQIERH